MATLEEIGQKTKAKYPEYAGKSDLEVGQAVVKKYPEYQSSITPSKNGSGLKTGLEAVARVLNVPSNIVAGVTGAKAEQITGNYRSPEVKIPGTNIDIGSQIPSGIVGAVRGVKQNKTVFEELPKAYGLNPESPAGMGVGFAGELLTPDLGDLALLSKAGKAVTKFAPGVVEKLPGAVRKAGEKITGIGEEIAQAGVRPTKTQAKDFYNAAKKTIGKYIADEKLAGDVAENVSNRISDVQGAYDDIALKSGKKVNLKDWLTSFDKAMSNLDVNINESEIKALNEFRDNLGSTIDKNGISLADLVKKRRLLDKKIPNAQWQKLLGGDAVSGNVAKRMFLQDVINEVGGEELQSLGQQLKKLYKLSDIAGLQEGISPGGRIGGLGDIVAAGAGASTGETLPDRARNAVMALLGRRVIRNPKVIGGVSSGVMKAGETLQNTGNISPNIIDMLSKLSSGTAKISKEALLQSNVPRTPQQSEIQALQRMIDKEKQSKTNNKKLP